MWWKLTTLTYHIAPTYFPGSPNTLFSTWRVLYFFIKFDCPFLESEIYFNNFTSGKNIFWSSTLSNLFSLRTNICSLNFVLISKMWFFFHTKFDTSGVKGLIFLISASILKSKCRKKFHGWNIFKIFIYFYEN